MKKGTTGSATVHIDAPPEKVYAVVSDITRMGEWSPETVKAEWIDGATGPAVGARFKGTNKHGVFRWSTKPTVVTADEGHQFAFKTDWRGKDSTKWSYTFGPDDGGTKVTESFEILNDVPGFLTFVERYFMRIKDRKADLESGMQKTLARLRAAVEGSAA